MVRLVNPRGEHDDKDPGRIAAMFDAIAGRYDLLNHLLSAGLDARWRARAVEALELSGSETVLDVCTGTADLAIAAACGRRGRAHRVLGVDFSEQMLRVGHDKARKASLSGTVGLVRGDATRLPLPSDSVDAVTSPSGFAT